jgi:hypothetical protein
VSGGWGGEGRGVTIRNLSRNFDSPHLEEVEVADCGENERGGRGVSTSQKDMSREMGRYRNGDSSG